MIARTVALFLFCAALARAQSISPGTTIPGLPLSLGQKTEANSTSVTIASDQSAIPITGSITVSASSAAIGTNGDTIPNSSSMIGLRDASGRVTPLNLGANGITVSASQGTNPWIVAVPTSVTTTVTSGTISATQGTSPWVISGSVTQGTNPWIVAVPTSVTTTVTSGSITANAPTASSSSTSRVSNSASNFTLISSNTSRKGLFLYNDSSTNCYVKFGATASTSSFTVKMFSTDTYIMDPPIYTGQVDAICDAASGSTEVSEL